MSTSATAAATIEAIEEELHALQQYSIAAGLSLDVESLTRGDPRIRAAFRNADDEVFFVEIDCTEYPKFPPTIEFLDEQGSERGHSRLYPAGFHAMPCVCMRYNRKAYSHGGPHSADWQLVDWQRPTGNGVGIDTLALIVSDLHSKISSSRGRLA